jgi:hypothetical protein
VFINYRAKDEPYGAAAIYQDLAGRFGAEQVFRDSVSLKPADQYPDTIRDTLRRSDVVLAVIGPEWLTLQDGNGTRLIDREEDWVRTEIADAFELAIPVLPVLLHDTPPLTMDDLPGNIARLAVIHSIRVGYRSFGEDLEKLARALVERVPHLAVPQLFETPLNRPTEWLPSALLRPEHETVPFAGRTTDIAQLHAWATGSTPVSARLLMSAAGDGKTRLARQLTQDLREEGWIAGTVRTGSTSGRIAGTARISKPMLLVVDDAEDRMDQVAAVATALVDHGEPSSTPRRLLLLSTHAEWAQWLGTLADKRVADIFGRMTKQSIGPLPATHRAPEFVRAGRAFAIALGRPAFDVAPPPELAEAQSATILGIHATALAELIDDGQRPSGRAWAPRNVMTRLRRHECQHWAQTGSTLDQRNLHVAVAAAAIFGAETDQQARLLLESLPGFSGLHKENLNRYLTYLAELYPGSAALNAMRPKQLAADHLVETLTRHPNLVAKVAPSVSDRQVEQMLLTLTRLASQHPDLVHTIPDVLSIDPDHFVPLALSLVRQLERPRPLVDAIKTTTTTQLRPETLFGMFERLATAGPDAMPMLYRLSRAITSKIAAAGLDRHGDGPTRQWTLDLQDTTEKLFDSFADTFTGQESRKTGPTLLDPNLVAMLRQMMIHRNKFSG